MTDLYVKKPIAVEAYEWDGTVPFNRDNGFSPSFNFTLSSVFEEAAEYTLNTAEGPMKIVRGSFIVRGPAGEYWAVRNDIFKNTYEKVNNEPKSA
jgi:hypothetical protein